MISSRALAQMELNDKGIWETFFLDDSRRKERCRDFRGLEPIADNSALPTYLFDSPVTSLQILRCFGPIRKSILAVTKFQRASVNSV